MEFDFTEPHRMIEAGPARLAYWHFGEGPNLVLIHGWPLTAGTFRNMLKYLAPHFSCHLFDLPGMGHSEWPKDAPFGLAPHAEVLAEAIEQVGLQKYSIFAHDSGATVGRLVAAQHQDRLEALIMSNTEIPGHKPWRLSLFLLLGKMPGGTTILRQFLKYGTLRRSTIGLGPCFDDPRFGDGEFFESQMQPLLQDRRKLQAQMRLVKEFDWSVVHSMKDAHADIFCPTLLVWGARDPYFPLAKAKAMMQQFAGPIDMKVIDRGKLYVHEDFAQEVADHTRSFLNSAVGHPALAVA